MMPNRKFSEVANILTVKETCLFLDGEDEIVLDKYEYEDHNILELFIVEDMDEENPADSLVRVVYIVEDDGHEWQYPSEAEQYVDELIADGKAQRAEEIRDWWLSR